MKGNVKQRGNTWSYIVDIGRDPITGKRRQKTKSGFLEKKMHKLLFERFRMNWMKINLSIRVKNPFHPIWNFGFRPIIKKGLKKQRHQAESI
ncbi:Arm DNA-binding domain-containing protein [Peribacillus frigoritolerans]|uniref:Arm DNA-binding domain-containing protein n=1 Tax=Peribacillus frigoritolerans TaxID=450367 RepID=UPI00381D5E46